MNFRMGHGTNTLAEENKLLKEMNARQEEGAGLFPSLGRDCYTPRYVDVRLNKKYFSLRIPSVFLLFFDLVLLLVLYYRNRYGGCPSMSVCMR